MRVALREDAFRPPAEHARIAFVLHGKTANRHAVHLLDSGGSSLRHVT